MKIWCLLVPKSSLASRRLMNRSDVDIIVNACEAHLHIPMADFVVYVVVAAPVKPDLIGQPVFSFFFFEVALFSDASSPFLPGPGRSTDSPEVPELYLPAVFCSTVSTP